MLPDISLRSAECGATRGVSNDAHIQEWLLDLTAHNYGKKALILYNPYTLCGFLGESACTV